MKFVSLHHHTTYSTGDGYGTPEQHFERAAELGYDASGLTEHGNVSSHYRAEKAGTKTGVKPVFGIEAYCGGVDDATRTLAKNHLTILAADAEGYANLNRVVTRSYLDFYGKPTVGGRSLAEHSAGLVILSGCNSSLLACTLLGGKGVAEHAPTGPDAALRLAQRFAATFPDYYLEVQAFPELDNICQINETYSWISRCTGIPMCATVDAHYPLPTDNDMQTILHAASRGKASVEDAARDWNYDVLLTLPESDAEIISRLQGTGLTYVQAQGAVQAAADIAARCNVTLPKAERLRFRTPGGMTAAELLTSWLRDGWRRRRLNDRPAGERAWYAARVQHELGIIQEKDFCDFILATADIVQWAKDQGITVGPGRGSAAASVVCWLLRITEVDPHRYPGMLFERFIDVTRDDAPDIDLDIADDRRHEVKARLEELYGSDCVGSIANFVHYRGKNALQDVGRVHNVPPWVVKQASDMVITRGSHDEGANETIKDTVAMFPAAKAIFDEYPALWQAARLEGNIKTFGMHAAGVVVSNTPLDEVCATYQREKADGTTVSVLSIDKYDAEYAGMLKMDFLGLSTMGMIARCLDLAGLTLDDLYAIPDTDPDTLRMFQTDDVVGVFQFEGPATRIICKDVKPSNFLEVADVNALSRPGPLFSGATSAYCDVKAGRAEAPEQHPVLAEITSATKYQIIYQEQIIQVAHTVGGFSITEAAEVRRIIGKKLGNAALQEKLAKFQAGARQLHGIEADEAERIWNQVVTSGTYAFNIAHAICYATLAWWCAWLKAHYPAEFYAASLDKEDISDKTSKAFAIMKDAIRNGIVIRPPMLNVSESRCRVIGGEVITGWSAVPKVGDVLAARITADRAENGPFDSWEHLQRIPGVGPKKSDAIQEFATAADPFGLERTARALRAVQKAVRAGSLAVPAPTHSAAEIEALGAAIEVRRGKPQKGPRCIWAGMIKAVKFKDLIEETRRRHGAGADEIIAGLRDPELTRYCSLTGYDDSEAEIIIRVNRFVFGKFARQVEKIATDTDIVIVSGHKMIGSFGNSMVPDELYVIG